MVSCGVAAEGPDFVVHGFAIAVWPSGLGQFVDCLPATWLSPFQVLDNEWAVGARDSAKLAVQAVKAEG